MRKQPGSIWNLLDFLVKMEIILKYEKVRWEMIMSRSLSLEEDSEVFNALISSRCAKFYEDSFEKNRRTDR